MTTSQAPLVEVAPEEGRTASVVALADGSATPACMTCGDSILSPAINFTNRHGNTGMWQCRECHKAEWGVWPPDSILSSPNT